MNLLQILTNENKILIKLITILFSTLEALLFLRIINQALKPEINKKHKIKFILIMMLSAVLSAFIPNSLIRDTISIMPFILLLKFLFKQSIKNTFVGTIITFSCALLSESLSTSFFIYVLKISYDTMANVPIYYFSVLSLTLLLIYFTISLVKLIAKKYVALKQCRKFSINTRIILALVLGILTMIIEAYLLSVYMELISFKLTITMIISSVAYFSVSMYSLIRTNILEKTEADLEHERLYNKTLSHLHDNIRGFKHDFDNIVQSIGGYISLNDMEGLTDYYKRLLEDCKMTNNLNLLNPETINNPSIYSLLTNKYYLAIEKGITMTFSIFTDLSHINFNMYEFSRILGILLDNAIEAAEESDQKTVNIEFTSDNKKQLFIISNSCKDTNISTTQIFEKGYSTKNRNSGFGLWHVHKVLEKNTNLDLFTTVKDNIFSQQLAVYY